MNNTLNSITKINFINHSIETLSKDDSWKKRTRLWGDWMHRICSYVAMFSPALVEYFIENYARSDNDIILDTFSGRGTTLLQARVMNKKAYAIDLNPLAYVITRAKCKSFKKEEVLDRIKDWENQYLNFENNVEFKEKKYNKLKIYYSNNNLKQLIFIRNKFGKNFLNLSEIDNFILALLLGIMHGPMKKDGSSIYLSISMSNHTSMSPNYVKKYSELNNLKKPKQNIFENIKNRAINILDKAKFYDNIGNVAFGNALEVEKYFDITPKLIFTSPPYLNLINYTNQNWIKIWLLGFEIENISKIKLDDKHNNLKYKEFIIDYLVSISKICNFTTKIVLVIGDVERKNNKIYSFEKLWGEIKPFVDLNLINIYVDHINQKNKATNSMGLRSGKATRVDKIYVFEKKYNYNN